MCFAKVEELDRRRFRFFDKYAEEKGIHHIAQDVIDSLIAVRASYEPTTSGAIDVLNRSYDLNTSQYELLHHREQESSILGRVDTQQTFVMVRSSSGGILIACRGTFNFSDLVQDVKLARVPVPYTSKGHAHLGFLERSMLMPLQFFLSLLRAGEKLIFTGHSMGAAVSSLVTLRLLEALAAVPGHARILRDRVKCITFAIAPFANLELAGYVNSRYRHHFHNLVSKNDLVPRSHNLLPNFSFPAAKMIVSFLNRRWEVQAAKTIIESMAGMPVRNAVKGLGEKVSFLWTITWLFESVLDCAEANEEAVCYGHCGYLVLLHPEAPDAEKVVQVDRMESLSQEFGMGSKSASELVFEHGMANYYECLVHHLSSKTSVSTPRVVVRQSCDDKACSSPSPVKGASLKDYLANPSRACLLQLHRILLNLTGNGFQASE